MRPLSALILTTRNAQAEYIAAEVLRLYDAPQEPRTKDVVPNGPGVLSRPPKTGSEAVLVAPLLSVE
jgi:hypothetical protein